MSEPRIRSAHEAEGAALSELALRSKAHWGYDEDFLDRCRPVLTVDGGYLRSRPVFVAEVDGDVAGFCSLAPRGEDVQLDLMYVEPAFIGRGVGRLLLRHALDAARRAGHARVLVESDPFAEPFYLRMGARRIGQVASEVGPARRLPLLALDMAEALDGWQPGASSELPPPGSDAP